MDQPNNSANSSTEASVSPSDAVERLKAGNARFASAVVSHGKEVEKARATTANFQRPFAVIVTCSDSRISTELLFDQNIGDLFVVRSAGNLVDALGLGSIEFGVGALGARLIVVLGHKGCGAVAATVAGGSLPGHLNAIVEAIRPAVEAARSKPGDLLDNAILENTTLVAAKIKKLGVLGDSDVKIVEAIYNLDSGVVDWINS